MNPQLSANALQVLEQRYLLKDPSGLLVETPEKMFARVSAAVALPERREVRREMEVRFYEMMMSLEFMPNSPTLMNAATSLGQLSACFVLPISDSISGIFEGLKNMARIHQTGGGTGFSFSNLRPRGDLVMSTKGEASGPVSFMHIFDEATNVIVQGGRRRGANMGILRCDHPDIVEFIESKRQGKALSNFNISVGITDAFMDAVNKRNKLSLVNPRDGKSHQIVEARDIFNRIVKAAWQTGDPGIVFLDTINAFNPTPALGQMESTNPCGELPLLPYESCNLGSINLALMANEKQINWEKLKETCRVAVRFLDNVISINRYPLNQTRKITLGNRKIGLGVMGFADLLVNMQIPYNSSKGIRLAGDIMRFVHSESLAASRKLAAERGSFPNWSNSIHRGKGPMRNATVNAIAPTGTISIICGCSSGIEPIFALAYTRNVLSGRKLMEKHPGFERYLHEQGLYNDGLMELAARTGSVSSCATIPEKVKRIFRTAHDLSPRDHVLMQAAFQRFTDNAVSKTINLPEAATPRDVAKVFQLAYDLKCRGITIYRYGSKQSEVLSITDSGKGQSLIADDDAGACCA